MSALEIPLGDTPLAELSARAKERQRRIENAEQLLRDFPRFVNRARPPGGFNALLVDVPWEYQNYSRKGEHKGAAAQYDCVPMEYARRLPVGALASRHCAVFAWATSPLLDQQIECVKAWGFRYVGFEAWFKGSKGSEGEPGDAAWKASFGTGYVRRSAAELIVIGACGSPDWQPACRSLRNALFDAAREHSRKPESQYARVEASVPGPYCEIFARENRRPGWASFGNEIGKFAEAA